MKKKYIEPEMILLVLINNEALMQESLTAFTGDKDDSETDDEVDNPDDLLSNFGNRLWEE
ncbi:MAG: hypothetical protein J5637_04845 [Prevotella sp.]|nr:hypothetical protein [Prevotella sp.]